MHFFYPVMIRFTCRDNLPVLFLGVGRNKAGPEIQNQGRVENEQ